MQGIKIGGGQSAKIECDVDFEQAHLWCDTYVLRYADSFSATIIALRRSCNAPNCVAADVMAVSLETRSNIFSAASHVMP